MMTFITGMSRFYNLSLRYAPIVNRCPYSSLRKRDIQALCYRYLPTHSFSLTTQDTEDTAWDCVGYERNVAKLKGLPWRTTSEEVVKFLGDHVTVVGGKSGVYRPVLWNNLPSGLAYVKLAESVVQAKTKSGKKLGDREILVGTCKNEELNFASKLARHHQKKYESETVNVVCQILKPGQKLEELSELAIEDIADFFAEFEIVPNGIVQTPKIKNSTGLSNGGMKVAAHVQFASLKMAQDALLRDGKMIKDCQIGVYRSIRSLSEAKGAFTPIPHSEFCVSVKNIPATASEHDIIEFFTSAGVTPVSVFSFQRQWDVFKVGAYVNFSNKEDVEKALKCDQNSIDDTSVRVTLALRQAESMTTDD